MHLGQEIMHLDELWEQKVSLDFFFFSTAEMETWLKTAGFERQETIARPPYEDVEYQSQRAYIFAKKPKQ